MNLVKGKKYRIRLSGMLIETHPGGPHTVFLDKCVSAIVLGLSASNIIVFADDTEGQAHCTWEGDALVGRRLTVTLDVLILSYYASAVPNVGSYRPALSLLNGVFKFGTYGLTNNIQFNAGADEFIFVSENENEENSEWPEEESGQLLEVE
jgi:hypothetical protein